MIKNSNERINHKVITRTAKLILHLIVAMYLFACPTTYLFIGCTSVVDEEKDPIRKLEKDNSLGLEKIKNSKQNLDKTAFHNRSYLDSKTAKQVLNSNKRRKMAFR